MSTDKENLVIYLSVLALLVIVVCSMLVKFNLCDCLYGLFVIYAIGRYIYLCRKN